MNMNGEYLYQELIKRNGLNELLPGLYDPPRRELNTGKPIIEKYLVKPIKPWMGEKKLSKKQRKSKRT